MIILTIRTDKPEAEIGLYNNQTQLSYEIWLAHRQLAETLHQKIQQLLVKRELTWLDIEAVVAYEGPGSFTGLRIGLSVANAIASGNGLSITATTGDDWITAGIAAIASGKVSKVALPDYGAPVHITTQKK